MFKDSLIRQTTGDKKNPFRYFTKHELKELFSLEDTHSSSTQLQLQSLHSSACRSDPELQCHISALKGMNMFAVSRHDLLFSNEEDEDMLQDEETHYIDQRVQKAQELVQAESQLNSLMMERVNKNTEPPWPRLSRQQGSDQYTAVGDGNTMSPCHNVSPPNPNPPAMVDLTQSGSDELEKSKDRGMQIKDERVIDLSLLVTEDSFVGQGCKSMNDEQSLIIEEKSDLTHSHSNRIIHISPFKQSDSSLALLATESKTPKAFSQVELGSPKVCFDGDSDATKVLLGVRLDSSVAPVADLSKPVVGVESDTKDLMGAESFQGNFNLQLEDSAELLSEDKQDNVDPEEVELSTGGEDFQLQMDDTKERLTESNHDSVGQKSIVSTPADESLLWPTKKKKLRVIYDSEEEVHEEEEVEKPVLASSPLASSFMGLGCSTPKSMLNNGSNCRSSMNISIASRRSLVESLLQDMEEEEEESENEEEPEEEGSSEGVLMQASETNGTHTDEWVLEEAEPSGETLNSEHTSECAEEEEGDGVNGFSDESADVELASSEVLDQCAPCAVHTVKSPNDVKRPEEMFDSLVHSGKRCLAEGRKQEALDFFLKAIDINTGDTEIQLLIIQLYRHLSH